MKIMSNNGSSFLKVGIIAFTIGTASFATNSFNENKNNKEIKTLNVKQIVSSTLDKETNLNKANGKEFVKQYGRLTVQEKEAYSNKKNNEVLAEIGR